MNRRIDGAGLVTSRTGRFLSSSVLGLLTTALALGISNAVAGGLLRSLLGVPTDFASDYTSPEAFGQAMLSHGICLAFAFTGLGIVLKLGTQSRRLRAGLFASNPITMGLGYALYQSIARGSSEEYVSLLGGALVTLVAPFICVPAVLLGARLRRGPLPAREASTP